MPVTTGYWTDSVLFDLRLLLKRLPGLEGLAWNDGTPFADEVTTARIAEKVNEEGLIYDNELATVVNGQADDVLLLESEAMEKGDTDGPEAALTAPVPTGDRHTTPSLADTPANGPGGRAIWTKRYGASSAWRTNYLCATADAGRLGTRSVV